MLEYALVPSNIGFLQNLNNLYLSQEFNTEKQNYKIFFIDNQQLRFAKHYF